MKELKRNPNANNLVSLCRDSDCVGIVDCGLKNKQHGHHPSVVLYNPKGKKHRINKTQLATQFSTHISQKLDGKMNRHTKMFGWRGVFCVGECVGDMFNGSNF